MLTESSGLLDETVEVKATVHAKKSPRLVLCLFGWLLALAFATLVLAIVILVRVGVPGQPSPAPTGESIDLPVVGSPAPGVMLSTYNGVAMPGLGVRRTHRSEIATVDESEQYPSSTVFALGWSNVFMDAYPHRDYYGNVGIRFIPGHYYTETEGFDHDWNRAMIFELNSTCTEKVTMLHMTYMGVCIEPLKEARRLKEIPKNGDDYQLAEMFTVTYSCVDTVTQLPHVMSVTAHLRPKGHPDVWVPNDDITDWGVHHDATRDSVAVAATADFYTAVIVFAKEHLWYTFSTGDEEASHPEQIPMFAQGEDFGSVHAIITEVMDDAGMFKWFYLLIAGPAPFVSCFTFRYENGTRVLVQRWVHNLDTLYAGTPYMMLVNTTRRGARPTGLAVGYKSLAGGVALEIVPFGKTPEDQPVYGMTMPVQVHASSDYSRIAMYEDLTEPTYRSALVVLSGDSRGTAQLSRFRALAPTNGGPVRTEWSSFRPVVRLVNPKDARPDLVQVAPHFRSDQHYNMFMYLMVLETRTPVMSEWVWVGGMHYAGIAKDWARDGATTVPVQREGVFAWTKDCGAPLMAGSPYFAAEASGQLSTEPQGDLVISCRPRVGVALAADKLLLDTRGGCFDPMNDA